MQLLELPRDPGTGGILGQWRLRHRSPDFTQSLGFVNFADGVAQEPLQGLALEQVMVAFGDAVEAEPWADDAPVVESAEKPPTPEPEQAEAAPMQVSAPTTVDELMALTEAQLRAIAAEMGGTDKRWGVNRLRQFIADELGIEE